MAYNCGRVEHLLAFHARHDQNNTELIFDGLINGRSRRKTSMKHKICPHLEISADITLKTH